MILKVLNLVSSIKDLVFMMGCDIGRLEGLMRDDALPLKGDNSFGPPVDFTLPMKNFSNNACALFE